MNAKVEINHKIDLFVSKNNAQANAVEFNYVEATVTVDGEPAAHQKVICQVDGNAYFFGHGNNLVAEYTDGGGKIRLKVLNNFPEDNNIFFFVYGDRPSAVSAELNFIPIREKFSIASIKTKNRTLFHGEPSIIWEGAGFEIITSGGSGQFSWSFEGESEGVAISANQFGDAFITAVAPFVGKRTVKILDEITQEVLTHTFQVNYFLDVSPDLVPLEKILLQGDEHLLNRTLITILFEQWGNLGEYIGWNSKVPYWTRSHDEVATNSAEVFNPVTGIYTTVKVVENDIPKELGFVSIIKR